MTRGAKLLIAWGSVAVSEGRQGQKVTWIRTTKCKRRNVRVASGCCWNTLSQTRKKILCGTVSGFVSCSTGQAPDSEL